MNTDPVARRTNLALFLVLLNCLRDRERLGLSILLQPGGLGDRFQLRIENRQLQPGVHDC